MPSAPIGFLLKGLILRRDVELPALDARAEFLVFQIDRLERARRGIRRARLGAEEDKQAQNRQAWRQGFQAWRPQ